jgi:hypothetical protein
MRRRKRQGSLDLMRSWWARIAVHKRRASFETVIPKIIPNVLLPSSKPILLALVRQHFLSSDRMLALLSVGYVEVIY